MSEVIPFQFDHCACPVRLDEHGAPWWGLLDVCRAITLQNTTDAAKRLRPHETTILDFTEDGMPHRLLLVNESGLYRLIMRSNKPEAERFQDWVCQEVLPQIRKTGSYAAPVPLPPSRTAELAYLREHVAFLADLGMCEHRDKLMLADMARNLLTSGHMLPGVVPGEQHVPSMPFFVSDRVRALGYHLNRKQEASVMPGLGKRVKAEYRQRYGEDPHQSSRFVDGAVRPVNTYRAEDAPWVDAIVQTELTRVEQEL